MAGILRRLEVGVIRFLAVRRCWAWAAAWAVWRLPPPLRWHVTVVIGTAAAAGVGAAVVTTWRPRDVLLFAALGGFAVAAAELTRRTSEPAGDIKDVHGVWLIPAALLLPPVYCLAAPTITFAVLQARTRATIAHRQVFSAAASGLALAAASATFAAARVAWPWLQPGPLSRSPAWLLAAAVAAVVWSAGHTALVMTAVRLSDRTVSIRQHTLSREPLLNDAVELAAGLLLAAAITTATAAVLILALPLTVALQRSGRHAQLVSAARVDAKTGLLTAAAWRAETTVQLTRAQRTHTPAAVLMADLDHFKQINDTHGHLTGDAVLATVAAAMIALLRDYDLCGRFGGEEFAIYLPDTTTAQAQAAAERLRAKIAQISVPAPGSPPIQVTLSIGVAAVRAARRDLDDLLAAADAALYTAKRAGRNQVVITGEDRPSQARSNGNGCLNLVTYRTGPGERGADRALPPGPSAQPGERDEDCRPGG